MPEFQRARDRDLLSRFRAGDRDAFAELYRTHHREVFRFALFMTGDDARAGEAMQDAFVWLIHHPGSFDPDRGDLGNFLVGVARKILLRRFSEQRRWIPLDDAIFADEPSVGCGEEDIAALRRAIAALPARYREVVVLCDLEEKTYEEAAVVIECAVGTVRSRLHRARALLARKLMGKGCPA